MRNSRNEQDRHLILRRGIYHYKRRVPAVVVDMDARSPHVRTSLKTADLALARSKRDALEAADDQLWAAMIADEPRVAAQARYKAAVKRVEAMGFSYQPASEIATADLRDVVSRLEAVMDERTPVATNRAVLGTENVPPVTLTAAFKVYTDEIVHDELQGKSESQKRSWKKVKQRAVNNFVDLAGDKAMPDITRADGLKVYTYWLERIAPKKGKPTHKPTSGNRDLGNLRGLYESYHKHMGVEVKQNPFDGLGFAEKTKRSRPPIPTEWIKAKLLAGDSLTGLNPQARGVLLAMIETGARPSELCNLQKTEIFLDVKVPYIRIEPREGHDNPREIKTESSVRSIPLVGVALAVFRAFPNGFPRYRDKENSLTTAINKYLRESELLPSDKHTFYSLRHSFEDRMKEGGLDEELRRGLMGHTIQRPKYGSGGALAWQRDELNKIALPFDPGIVEHAQTRRPNRRETDEARQPPSQAS
ncbi:DUF6538 domain-containing protein [Aminobacter sp. MDW-2]|uniref:DUF6538 domain-containing protein n=1 Tax=Aminobacter sp. MDW-2 TaxID=2666139 RepID=UPI0012AFCD42|nr:DUF6538 domain-containing protein [Aminobacter sp. MDW-2]MRX31863.1 tyrosine-type recombinase/integrase [Aminobacter sp. MDW-2]QNH32339.1 tyrosine-type recombinase/integrase [Aminobacter sp. MDW-2]